MKVLLFNGSPNKEGNTYTALCQVEQVLRLHGIETEIFHIGKEPVAGCMACGSCRTNSACIIQDKVNALAARLDEFDGIVIGSPVYYAGPSGQSTAFLDRLFYSASAKLRGKPGAAVLTCCRGGATAAYDRLNKYFGITSMPIVTSDYWNHLRGNSPEDILQDPEGIQTMRTLGENMAWLLKCIEAGKKAGISAPQW